MTDALSASTARLVSASTVKNVDASRIQKLVEASKQVKASAKGLVDAAKASSQLREQKVISENLISHHYRSKRDPQAAELDQSILSPILRLRKWNNRWKF